MNLFIDIEAIPCQQPHLISFIADQVKPPATISKPESIDKWLTESKQHAIEESIRRTSFDGAFGEVICICAAIGNEPIKKFARTNLISEDKLLILFAAWLNTHNHRFDTVVGFNHIAYDLCFLWKRAVVHNVPLYRLPRNAKPWDRNVYDVMMQWDQRNHISLHKLATALGIESDNNFSGADVYPMWQRAEYTKIADYCADDVELTRQIYKRMTFVREELDLPF